MIDLKSEEGKQKMKSTEDRPESDNGSRKFPEASPQEIQEQLNQYVRTESRLIWMRFNVMVVAHSIFLGLLTATTQENTTLTLIAIFGGTIVTYLWWTMTSVAWDLSQTWGNMSEIHGPEHFQTWKIMDDWRDVYGFYGQDFIWWSAHGVIWVFLAGYSGYAGWLTSRVWPELHPVGPAAVAILLFLVPFLIWLRWLLFHRETIRDRITKRSTK